MTKSAGHKECGASTTISEHLSFGRGKLDDFGFWEIPCAECARAFEKAHPEHGKCWPFGPNEFANKDSQGHETNH